MHEIGGMILAGITIGGAYAIIAIGLSLIYGVSEVFNYAYGSLLMVAAYFAWTLFQVLSGVFSSYGVVFAIVLPSMFWLGMGIETSVIRPLRRHKNWQMTAVLTTLALGLVINNILLVIFGPYHIPLGALREGIVSFAGFSTNENRIAILVIAIAIVVGLVFFLKRTRLGMSMRAVAQDLTGANIVGIPRDKVFSYTFGLCTVLAAIGGIFTASLYTISPEGGWTLLIKAFIILVLGGVGSLPGAVMGAFTVGILESAVSYYLGSVWVYPMLFIVFVGVLTIRPRGFLGIR